ncbi:hypothetical protein ACRAQ7_14320 [Erythrobacter sp. W53]|uniref:hypothetical protein n=1 Tax=Erythrobacter sp. W53 TaxID=3425947 RepID=UPI003D769EFA
MIRDTFLAVGALTMLLLGVASPAEAQRREYVQTIYLSGFYCIAVQRDSVVGPANEVFFTFVTNAPATQGISSSSVGTFKGVVPGYSRKTRNMVWTGRQQDLALRVAMWEQDAGGETGTVVAKVMMAALTAAAGRAGGKSTGAGRLGNTARNAGMPNSRGGTIREDAQAERGFIQQMGRGASRVFGLGHDLMGYARQTFDNGDWSAKPTYNERGIRYHFYTSHRRGGANCRAYFLIERGQEVPRAQTPQERPPQIAQRAPEQSPSPDQPYPDQAQPNGYYSDPNGPYPPEPPLPPPPEYIPPPPAPEPEWYRARFINRCKVPVSFSYAYQNPSRGWVKRGWGLLDPGESKRMEGNTLLSEVYVYLSKGRISGSFDPMALNLSVRSKGFDTDRSRVFQGEGARMARYSQHFLSDISGVEAIPIVDCDDWVAGELAPPTRPQRTVPTVLPYTTEESRKREAAEGAGKSDQARKREPVQAAPVADKPLVKRAAPEPAAPTVSSLPPQKSDPAVDAERRRELIERGILTPNEEAPPDTS